MKMDNNYTMFYKTDCMIRDIGNPVLQRETVDKIGAWFQDAMPTNKTKDKYYSTVTSDANNLYEFNSRESFFTNTKTAIYEVPFPISGTGHLVYNGSFYYHQAGSQMLVRLDFNRERSFSKQIADASYNDGNFLYSSELGYMDVMADENGLWVVYSAKNTNNTLVRKLNPYTLFTEYMWNLTFPHRSVGEMFIVCGVLYAVDSVTARSTRIQFAFDVYQNKVLEVNIPFWNLLGGNSMVSYNPNCRVICTWDNGYSFVCPVQFESVDLEQLKQEDNP